MLCSENFLNDVHSFIQFIAVTSGMSIGCCIGRCSLRASCVFKNLPLVKITETFKKAGILNERGSKASYTAAALYTVYSTFPGRHSPVIRGFFFQSVYGNCDRLRRYCLNNVFKCRIRGNLQFVSSGSVYLLPGKSDSVGRDQTVFSISRCTQHRCLKLCLYQSSVRIIVQSHIFNMEMIITHHFLDFAVFQNIKIIRVRIRQADICSDCIRNICFFIKSSIGFDITVYITERICHTHHDIFLNQSIRGHCSVGIVILIAVAFIGTC